MMTAEPPRASAATETVVLSSAEAHALRESRRMFATLLSNLPGMAYRYATDTGMFEFVSEGCQDLTGYPADDLLRGTVTWDDLLSSQDWAWTRQLVDEAVRERRAYQFTFPFRSASGALKWAWEQGQAIYMPDGSIVAFEGFITDISERIRAHELLEERVTERTGELTTLLEVARSISSTLDLHPLLGHICEQVSRLTGSNGASILLLEDNYLRLAASRAAPANVGASYPFDNDHPASEVIRRQQPIVIRDVHSDEPMACRYREKAGPELETTLAHVRSWLATPLSVRDRVIGVLGASHPEPDFFTPHHVELVSAIASQAAIAIENARLLEESRTLAVVEERQRLARELHDSVSQALYGIGLGARTARTLLDIDPVKVAEPLDYVLQLAEVGLAEMRALIFELRPESLESEGLVPALAKQATAIQARYGVTVRQTLPVEPPASLEVKETMYRIAQEAMHNTVKHARATTIELRLATSAGRLMLEVADDGRGFDANDSFPGHLRLISMRERAARVGGTFSIESAPGAGACIRVDLPATPGG